MTQRRTSLTGPTIKRLETIQRVPSAGELQNMLEAASEYGQYIIQISWYLGGGAQAFTLALTVKRTPFESNHRWAFYNGLEPDHKIEWVYETPDATLIHNMLLCAFADEALAPEAHNSYAYSTAAEATTKKQPPPSPAHSSSAGPIMAAPQLSLPTPPGLSPGAAGQATSQSSAAAIAPANDSNLVISGNLEKIRIDLLMQSLSASRLTGYVDLQRPTTINDPERGTIYFDQGIPVHCQNGTLKGEEAIVEIFTWKGGEFKAFEEKEPCLQRTINRRLDFLLLESNTISQYQSYLQEHKINAETVLTKVERKAGPESAAEPGPTNRDATEGLIDGDLQVRFCALLDNQNTIGDIARLLSLSKPAWTRLVYHMLRSGLARKHSGIYVGGQETLQQSRQAEAHGQDHIALTLRNKTTGFYTHDYFKVLLQQELNRYIVHHRPFAVLLLHVRKEPGPKIEVKTVAERMDEITQLLRPSDYFCHFEGSSFAVILPETDATEARGLVKQILRFLADADANIAASLKVHANNEGGNDKSDNEKSANNKGHLWLKIGAAGVPDDSENLEALLKMAQHPDNSTVLRLH